MIEVQAGFAGANPQDKAAIDRIDEAAFRIRPYSEDGDGNYKFCLLVGVANDSAAPAEVRFAIDWADAVYMSCRDYVLLGRGDRWRYFPAALEGSIATASVVVPPGRHQLALHPTYGLDRLRPWRRLAGSGGRLTSRVLAVTPGGRNIEAFELGPSDAPASARIAILARCHPYETAGSFLAEGALRQLLRGGPRTDGFVSAILVGNPDGVADGLCKRTARGGANLEVEGGVADDATARTVRDWLDGVRPAVLLDLHGWMHRYQDGFTYTHEDLTAQMKQRLLGVADIDRGWRSRQATSERSPCSLWAYAMGRHGTRSLVFSFGWYGRSVAHMRRIGAAAMAALGKCRW